MRRSATRILASLGLATTMILSLLGASALLLAPQASAAGAVTLSPPPDAVIFPSPGRTVVAYGYAVAVPAQLWTLAVSLEEPDGRGFNPTTGAASRNNPPTGTQTITIDRAHPGVHRLSAVLTWIDAGGATHVEPAVTTAFRLTLPATRTALAASPRRTHFGGRVHFAAASVLQTETGFRANSNALIRLQGRNKHRWVTLDTARSSARGRARWVFTWNTHRRRLLVRAVTDATVQNARSVTRPVAIHSH